MTRYLLAADADKIQDFVFRASHLREVTGGSNLLSRFCKDMPEQHLGCTPADIFVHDGGSFRLAFDTVDAVIEAGSKLSDYYYMTTGCTLSVAPPVEWDGTPAGFKTANRRASDALRGAKRSHEAATTAHIPQAAFCASTGVEIASAWASAKSGEAANYLSRGSLLKQREREGGNEAFVEDFIAHVETVQDPGQFNAPDEAGKVGRAGGYDPRDYVAYLVADGNGMGALFDGCEMPHELQLLSRRLGEIVRDSLAEPAKMLMPYRPETGDSRLIPVLPMILGGDDVFVLTPATWAVSFAQEFCLAFQGRMKQFLEQEMHLKGVEPTMAAAVVICKSKYPFQLAHRRGEELLKEAKRLSKGHSTQRLSVVNFELIVGNRLVDDSREGDHRPTLRPYWVVAAGGAAPSNGVASQQLLDARRQLSELPQKRRAELRSFFEPPKLSIAPEKLQWWHDDLSTVLQRTGQLGKTVEDLLVSLGSDKDANYWRSMFPAVGSAYQGNAMMDVFDAWDYLYDLKQDQRAYQEALA